MTKREIKTIVTLFHRGVSHDICRTAIIQRCCPNLPRKELNELSDALETFYELLKFDHLRIQS